MDQDSLMEQARSTNIDAVILESHRNGVDNSPVKSLQDSEIACYICFYIFYVV